MGYRRLTLEDRYQIAALKKTNHSLNDIGCALGRPASTISREIRANGGWRGYDGHAAHLSSKSRRKSCRRGPEPKIVGETEKLVRERLQSHWSPEQISGRLKRDGGVQISCSSIYRFIYRDAKQRGELWRCLRTQRRKRKRQKRAILARNFRKLNEVRPIRDRPRIVDQKRRIGDLERDLIWDHRLGSAILTINDRATRRVQIAWIPSKSSEIVHQKTLELLKNYPQVRTITNDHGTEFAKHRDTEKALGVRVYFSNKGCAWERGANENTNGLLRQYFPRSMDFSQIRPAQLLAAENLLNNRPRKCLGYRTPSEVHEQLGQLLR